jgi:branched-chain amino acid aminotransferase
MCFFLVRDGRPITPSLTNDVLESITRSTILHLAREHMGVEPIERDVDRSELYAAEEAFFCGTGWEITPITSINGLPIGTGEIGPVVRLLQKIYFEVVEGRVPDHSEWRVPVYQSSRVQTAH